MKEEGKGSPNFNPGCPDPFLPSSRAGHHAAHSLVESRDIAPTGNVATVCRAPVGFGSRGLHLTVSTLEPTCPDTVPCGHSVQSRVTQRNDHPARPKASLKINMGDVGGKNQAAETWAGPDTWVASGAK